MNVFGSPFPIDYLTYRFSTGINNVWAWVAAAIAAAAVGLWRIKGFSSPSNEIATTLTHSENTAVPTPAGNLAGHLGPALTTTSCCASESEGSPKGKFTAYYYNDDVRGRDDGGGRAAAEREESRWRSGDDWERTVVARMGDMGWYRFLDLKALDGNVVRLWDRSEMGILRWRAMS